MKHSQVYDHYYLYEEIACLLRGYAQAHPDFCSLSAIGQTPEGRDILLLSVTDLSAGGFEQKPAVYVEGNIHCGEVTGCMTVMYLLDTIFSNLDEPKVAALLRKNTIYAVPRLSPDGSEYYLTRPGTLRSAPRMYPYPELQPGLQRQDIDGDGVIRLMRVKTPYGAWKVSSKDPRVMTRRQPDDRDGDFYNVYDEGLIKGEWDGLGIVPAPAPFGSDFNRNYPYAWQTEDTQAGSGDYPLSNPETKANADFLLAHPNVCAVVDMHTAGGQNLYTPGYKSAKDAAKEDIALYKAMANIARQENGYPVLNVHDEYMIQSKPETYGGFDDFCHFVLGIPAMTIECWNLAERSGVHAAYPPREDKTDAEKEDELLAEIKWLDENVGKDVYQAWTPFEHPQLGPVEIGGCDSKFTSQNPPPAYLEQELAKHTSFLLRLPNILPDLRIDTLKTTKLADGLYKVEAVCGNRGYMPTYVFKEGLKSKRLKGVTLELDGPEIVSGAKKCDLGHLQGNSGYTVMNRHLSVLTSQVGPMRRKAAWIVRGNSGDTFTVTVTSGKAGSFTVEGKLE